MVCSCSGFPAAAESLPDGEDGVDVGAGIGKGLIHRHLGEPVSPQQRGDGAHPVLEVVYLDDRLPDPSPIIVLDAAQHIELRLLDVDLQEVDALDPTFVDELRHGLHLAGDGLAAEIRIRPLV